MPAGWGLSFFGMFRGRPGSPLRVCGYLGNDALRAVAQDPSYLPGVFDQVGFTAYDDAMLRQVRALMGEFSEGADFQLDVYPDGSLGSIFAVDLQFGIEQPASVLENFSRGPASRVMGLLQAWGAADDRCFKASMAEELYTLLYNKTAAAYGPGTGGEADPRIQEELLKTDLPLVIDADGLRQLLAGP